MTSLSKQLEIYMSLTWQQLQAMSTEDLRALNSNVVAIIRTRVSAEQIQQKAQFRIGQVVKVLRPSGSWAGEYMRVDKINTKTISGAQVDKDGKWLGPGWRAAPGLLRAI